MTSFDVAAEAGVSQSTVSRALAGDTVVSPATREKVRAAAARLNYFVDENAARLRTGRTGTLAVVVIHRPGEDIKDFNPFYYALLGSTCAAASRRGHETLVSFQDGSAEYWGLYHEQRKADGLIVIGTTENQEAWDYFRGIAGGDAQVVCWGAPADEMEWVRSDNAAGARLAVEHLTAAGCRQIVCIASEISPQRQFKERYEGYAAVMRDLGQPARLVAISEGLSREAQGRAAVAALLASGEAFDGIFAVCDEIALGALHALRENGLAVPQAVKMVGFDGIRAGAHASPPLTSVAPNFQIAGEMLVDRLLGLIAGEAAPKARVPVRLVERGSS